MHEAERLGPQARATALALARAVFPSVGKFREPDDRTIAHAERLLSGFGRGTVARWGTLLGVADQLGRLPGKGKPLSRLPRDEIEKVVSRWSEEGPDVVRRTFALAVLAPLKIAYFDDEHTYERFNCVFRFRATPEPARWMQQVVDGADITEDAEVECDAVVVGTGAGGAVVAAELAKKGLAVLMLEEGRFHTRADFDGRGVESVQRFYRGKGTMGSIGNTFIPIPMGRLVGGSTAINTGTCWRTPEWVLERWVSEEGLDELAPDRLAPYFDRVERELDVTVADVKFMGGVARVIARGCDALGYSHMPLRRNAPGCDGSGVCDFGCPTDARRSTNVSYVPAALSRGANLYTGVRADELIRENGRVAGIVGTSVATGKRLRIRARASILSCGTVMTPTFLARSKVARHLSWLGQNLSIHPATTVSALCDEEIRGFAAIPQGYCIDEFRREGILFLGASAPIDLGALQFAFVGKRLMSLMDQYDKVASFGVMVDDETRGRVTLGPGGRPVILYRLGRIERERLRRGVEILSRVFLAAGAREVYPAVHGHRVIRSPKDLARLASSLPAASDWLLTAFHPLGTCRMARTAARGVVSPDHEVFGVPGLYVADGSVVPSSIGVNPQVTIMALATRAADRIADRLS